MFRKFFTYPVFLLIFLFIIGLILFGSLLRHHYLGGERIKYLQKIAVFVAEIPSNALKIINPLNQNQAMKPLLVNYENQNRFKNLKPGFNFKNKKELDILFLLNYTNPSNNKHEVNLIDLKTYKSIFEYKFDYKIFTQINSENNDKFKKHIKNKNFALRSTFLTEKINFIALTTSGLITKFSPITNEVIWFNDKYNYHHTFYVNEIDNYIWAIGCSKNSNLDKIYLSPGFCDDSIIKINLNTGQILNEVSITQLMIDAELHNYLFIGRDDMAAPDPLHINDIAEINIDTSYSNKKNLFISVSHANMILLINPYKKKILWKLQNKLFHQHDVDIINSDEIAIFNNNRIFTNKDQVFKNNEINIFNFSNNKLSSPYDKILKENDVRTVNQGLFEITDYGVFVEEQNAGRYIFFEKNGEVIFEYINKAENDVYQVHWSSLIVNKKKILKIRSKFANE